jgi:hypothetical protein
VEKRAAYLLGALVAAVGLWLWSRTPTGNVIFVDAIETLLNGPRGVRNNNPGNIDWIENPSKRWRGMVRKESPEEGGRFAIFDSPANGVRAIAQELLLDERRGIRTIAGLISAWAPPGENNTPAYVRAVARAVGVEPDDSIDVRSYLPRLVASIIHHENGIQPYSADDLNVWVYS